MEVSILAATKDKCDIPRDYLIYDNRILDYINSALGDLRDIGVGPAQGFRVEGYDEEWEDFYGDVDNWDRVQTLVFLKVRLLFDPPQTGHHMTAAKEQIDELMWRLNVQREGTAWTAGQR